MDFKTEIYNLLGESNCELMLHEIRTGRIEPHRLNVLGNILVDTRELNGVFKACQRRQDDLVVTWKKMLDEAYQVKFCKRGVNFYQELQEALDDQDIGLMYLAQQMTPPADIQTDEQIMTGKPRGNMGEVEKQMKQSEMEKEIQNLKNRLEREQETKNQVLEKNKKLTEKLGLAQDNRPRDYEDNTKNVILPDVKRVLGSKNVEILIDATKKGDISKNQMQEIAALMDCQVLGNFKRRRDEKEPCDVYELRKLLDEWWNFQLFEYDNASCDGLNRLITILDEVGLYYIAAKMRSDM